MSSIPGHASVRLSLGRPLLPLALLAQADMKMADDEKKASIEAPASPAHFVANPLLLQTLPSSSLSLITTPLSPAHVNPLSPTSAQTGEPLPLLHLQHTSSSGPYASLASPSFAHPLSSPSLPPSSHLTASSSAAASNPPTATAAPLASPTSQPFAPLSSSPHAVSPTSEDDNSDSDSDSDTDAPTDKSKLSATYSRPLLFYHRTTHLSSQPSTPSIPAQLLLPNGQMAIGLAANKSHTEQHSRDDNIRLMVFSLPTDEMRQRGVVFFYLLLVLFAIDFILLALIYADNSWIEQARFSDGNMDRLTFACELIELLLGCVVLRVKEVRMMSMFIVIVYVDMFVNLLRCYSVLLITHFIIQFAICQVMTQHRVTLQPTWFTPTN